jgi:hypothetical protein
MSFKLVKSESLPLTRELAAQHLNTPSSPTERDLDPSRVSYLASQAEAKKLVAFNWAIAKLGKETYRMNGLHSSTMLTKVNGAFPTDLIVHLDEYEVDSMSDMASLFRQFDSRKSARSAADIAGAYQGLHPVLASVGRSTAKLAAEGIAWYLKFIAGAPASKGDDRYDILDNTQYHPFIVWLGTLYTIKTPELRTPAIVAAIYAIWIANQVAGHVDCKLFWEEVARGGSEFEEEDPTTVLDDWLKLVKTRDGAQKIVPLQVYAGCVYAWNAYRAGKPIKGITPKDKKIPNPAE